MSWGYPGAFYGEVAFKNFFGMSAGFRFYAFKARWHRHNAAFAYKHVKALSFQKAGAAYAAFAHSQYASLFAFKFFW